MVSVINFSDHQILRLNAGSFVDKLKIGDNWDSLNFGVLMRFTFDTNPPNGSSIKPLNFHLGLCSGVGTGIDSYPLAAVNYVGLKIGSFTIAYQDSGGYKYVLSSAVGWDAVFGSKMQGSTEATVQLPVTAAAFCAGANTYFSIYGIQINRSAATVKGFAPFSSMGGYTAAPISTYSGNSWSRGKLRQNVRGDITENMIFTGAASLAMPTGPLDHICICLKNIHLNADIHAIHVHKIS